MSKTFYHQTVTTEQIEKFLIDATGISLTPIFDQYLRNTQIPIFEYTIDGKIMKYHWSKKCISSFNMPIKISINSIDKWITPSLDWKQLEVEADSKITVDPNFYVFSSNMGEN